jgi:purine-binding chemotaxis protein CheW
VSTAADRLLAFEVGPSLFALPIAEVAEVMEVPAVAAVPMLPRDVGGVVNHHGDALPIVTPAALLGTALARDPAYLLVLARDPDDPSRYGVPIDRIHGLVDGPAASTREPGAVVAERRPLAGRLMHVLDAKRLLERALHVIEGSMAEPHSIQGGES